MEIYLNRHFEQRFGGGHAHLRLVELYPARVGSRTVGANARGTCLLLDSCVGVSDRLVRYGARLGSVDRYVHVCMYAPVRVLVGAIDFTVGV
jgi:hypothetical protein